MHVRLLILRNVSLDEAPLYLRVGHGGVPEGVLHARPDEVLVPLGVGAEVGGVVGHVHGGGAGHDAHQQRQGRVVAAVLQQVAYGRYELRGLVVA